VFQWFLSVFYVFLQVFQMRVSSISSVLFCMLQVGCFKWSSVAHVMRVENGRGTGPAWACETHTWAGDVRAAWALTWMCQMETRKQTRTAGVCPDIRTLAVQEIY
jgi:hypothetical protein